MKANLTHIDEVIPGVKWILANRDKDYPAIPVAAIPKLIEALTKLAATGYGSKSITIF